MLCPIIRIIFPRYSSSGIIYKNYCINTKRGVRDVSIKQIEIKYYKSIDSCVLTLENVNLFIGENGTGKSTLMKWIYNPLLIEDYIEEHVK